jgi:hypothetical protein
MVEGYREESRGSELTRGHGVYRCLYLMKRDEGRGE